ncbi:MAG TPA: hypothetical protein VFS76_01235 [Pyrinomonadaceae bacterium]|nr:hypothetical protein [Pyrinomonadaceae bacterium]
MLNRRWANSLGVDGLIRLDDSLSVPGKELPNGIYEYCAGHANLLNENNIRACNATHEYECSGSQIVRMFLNR